LTIRTILKRLLATWKIENDYSDTVDIYGKKPFAPFKIIEIPDEFQQQIIKAVQRVYEAVQNSPDPDICRRIWKGFDYDPMGNVNEKKMWDGKTELTVGLNIKITKYNGIQLQLDSSSYAYELEESLAEAINKKRGFRLATIRVPINNQTERDGSFFVNLAEACQKMGIPVTEEQAEKYIEKWVYRYQRQLEYEAIERLILWEDEIRGVKVRLKFPGGSKQSIFKGGPYIWGQLPENEGIFKKERIADLYPRIEIEVRPPGDPFYEEGIRQTYKTINKYTRELNKFASLRKRYTPPLLVSFFI